MKNIKITFLKPSLIYKGVTAVFLASLLWFSYLGIFLKVPPAKLWLVFAPKTITPINPLYPVKLTREYFQSLFIFGDEDGAYWELDLAEKRLKEASFLNRYGLAAVTLRQVKTAAQYQKLAKEKIDYLSDKTNVTYLLDKYQSNQDQLKGLVSGKI